MKIALAHHWLLRARGGERVLAHFAEMFPDAPIFTTLVDRRFRWPAAMSAVLDRVQPSPLQWTGPLGNPLIRYLVPLMPLAARSFERRLRGYDLLLVSDAGLAKCIPVPPGTRKFVYAHTPMRRLWQADDRLAAELPAALAGLAGKTARRVREQDRDCAQRVDCWAANSDATRRRLQSCYGIEPGRVRVIHPSSWVLDPKFRDAAGRSPAADAAASRSGLLVVSPMVPYKRDDLAILAASRLGVPLIVAGDGPERRRLQAIAGPDVRFVGQVGDRDLLELYRLSQGLVFCADEDFGLVPVEAMALGCPVLAYRAGGAMETVREGIGGLFFEEQSVDSVSEGMGRLLARPWDPRSVRASVERFAPSSFEREIRDWLGVDGALD